ncbi:MAG: SAM-dependent methyltransferase [Gammaproteobacteria bacterium]|jgi:SAM-dependent MidA family methyltransferase
MKEAMDAAGLPEPSAEAREHSRRLQSRISDAIAAAGGAIRFAEFMEMALYSPGMGYYSAGSRKFGSGGDFTTAPELSPLFSACVAGAASEVLAGITGGEILEIGGGSGALALEVLRALDSRGELPRRYRILEISADLKDRQQRLLAESLPSLVDRVRWVDELPADMEGVIIANEVLDAIPCERFRIGSPDPEYLGVGTADGAFRVVSLPADDALRQQVRLLNDSLGEPLAPGYASEWCPGLKPLVSSLAGSLKRGVLLLFDYGLPRRQLYHPERSEGTLMCHYRHRAHGDPFLYPGLQDITAWVDFTAVAEAAVGAGLVLDGFTTQAHFLLGSGIAEMAVPDPTDLRKSMDTAAQVRALTLPGEMGERFKVMAFSRGWSGMLPGLTRKDLSGSL